MQNNVTITNSTQLFRQDFAIISGWVKFGSKVLDLGCGDGELLKFLRNGLEVKG
jgi:cyclopropane fatty-acyl-phospholipid synthase-like methyltransferase